MSERASWISREGLVIGIWVAAALAYTAYAANTYSGLYRMAAEFQLLHVGSFDPTVTFLGLLAALVAPSYFVSPTLWRQRNDAKARIRAPSVADAAANARKTTRILLAIGGLLILVGLGAGALITVRDGQVPVIATIDLTPGTPAWSGSADQLLLNGFAQPRVSEIFIETHNGSRTRTLFTPVTAQNWTAAQPVAFVIREALGSEESGSDYVRRNLEPVKFGPAIILRGAMPGIIRAAFERKGLTFDPAVVVLDENLGTANDTLWIVSIFGLLFGFVLMMLTLVQRRVAGRTAAKGR